MDLDTQRVLSRWQFYVESLDDRPPGQVVTLLPSDLRELVAHLASAVAAERAASASVTELRAEVLRLTAPD
ncbi:MAG: hypothetical protein ACOYOQ_14390 [Microthrixaceae bacterium]